MAAAPAAPLLGALLFADAEPPPIGRFRHLPGFAASPAPQGVPWSAELEVGGALVTLEPMTTFMPFPEVLLSHDPRLTDRDRAVVRAARSAVHVRVTPRTEDPFHARKRLVLAMGAALGPDGAAALDVAAQRIWPREDLEDELAHDAPLDVNQMYVTHAVSDNEMYATQTARGDRGVQWLHSHGLAELGRVDFDILRPHGSHLRDLSGLVRAMALASVEGRLGRRDPFRPCSLLQEVCAVPVTDFMRSAAREDAQLRHEDESHTEQRVVLCDPPGKMLPGWLSKPRPSRLFQSEVPDGTLIYFSDAASAMAAERARGTYRRFRAIFQELADLQLPCLVKLGYRIDGGEPHQREHLWFQVHECFDDAVDAMLINDPYDVSALRKGELRKHDLGLLSDWAILTPAGEIKPSTLHVARVIRQDRTRIERHLAEYRARTS
jgi:hypothetical protein